MKTLSEIQQWLAQNKIWLREHYQVKSLGVFGSYVRQEEKEDSDLDILVEFTQAPSLLKFIKLEHYLTDNLGIQVDLVHRPGLKPRLGERILAEVIFI